MKMLRVVIIIGILILILASKILLAEDDEYTESSSLTFYTRGPSKMIYEAVDRNLLSFSVSLPPYEEDLDMKFKTVGKQLEVFKTYAAAENQDVDDTKKLLIESLVLSTKEYIDKSKQHLKEIAQYRRNDTTEHEYGFCHTEIYNQIDPENIEIVFINIQTLAGDFTEQNITSANFGSIRNYISLINLISKNFYLKTSSYLEKVEKLAQGELSFSMFQEVSNSECMRPNSHRDIPNIDHCHWSSDSVYCLVNIAHPHSPKLYHQLMGIPYYGYEVNLAEIYMNEEDQAVSLDCETRENINFNCKTHEIRDECIQELQRNYLENILEECSFLKTTSTTPTLTQKGILIPIMKNLKIYEVIESVNELGVYSQVYIEQNITETDEPIILRSPSMIRIEGEYFNLTFSKSGEQKEVIKTVYTSDELDEIKETVQLLFSLTDEQEDIIIYSSLGFSIFTLLGIGIFLCIKFMIVRAKAKRLADTYLPKNSEPRELRKFLKENP